MTRVIKIPIIAAISVFDIVDRIHTHAIGEMEQASCMSFSTLTVSADTDI
jgi:hypothetical protein